MRVESQPWPNLRVSLELIFGGTPVTGSTATATLYRVSDGNYWNGAAWVGVPATFSAAEHPAFPGLYTATVPPADVDYAASEDGYIVRLSEATTGVVETAFISHGITASGVTKITDGVLDEGVSGHTTGGSVGESLIRILALRQNNNRVVYTAWNTAGVPTAGTVYIYATQADMLADAGGTGAGSIGSYAITASFDGSLRPTEYTSGKVT